jgi:hypothetical protein
VNGSRHDALHLAERDGYLVVGFVVLARLEGE